jgi:hypothetical protein
LSIFDDVKILIGVEVLTIDFKKEFQPRHRSGCASEFGYAGGQVEHHYQFGIDLGGGVVDAYPARVKGLLQRRELWTQALTLPSSARAGDRCGRESWCPRWYLPLCRCTERQGRTGCCHRCL